MEAATNPAVRAASLADPDALARALLPGNPVSGTGNPVHPPGDPGTSAHVPPHLLLRALVSGAPPPPREAPGDPGKVRRPARSAEGLGASLAGWRRLACSTEYRV
eukprot:701471-Prorocentrum_minimum.AAC.1